MTDFSEIRAEFDRLEERKPVMLKNELKKLPVFGFDTETVDGKAVLLACSSGQTIFPESFDDIAGFLTQRKFCKSLNFFWNIDFDFFAIIKHLPPELLEILYECKGVIYSGYFIRWIPRKFFSIQKFGNKWIAKFYDLWQFYRSSLNEAAKKYLNDAKLEIDVAKIGEYMKTALGRSKLIAYCVKDAQLTQKLGELLQSKLNGLGIDFSKPFSCGSISQRYFFRDRQTFGFKKTEWNLYALYCYYGGRFEVIRRGYFRKVYQYDINSAYPYFISRLTDPTRGEWVKRKDVDFNNADYGFARIVIRNYHDCTVSPIPFRADNMVIYPNFDETELEYYLSYPELQLAEKMGLEYDVIDSWVFYGSGERPFEFINELYEARKKAKKENDRAMELVLKIVMNSLYGKFAEKQPKIRAYLKPCGESKEIVIGDQKFYVAESNQPGLLFCPVLAAYITSQTRAMLLETCLKNDTVMFATDSILTTKPIDSGFVGEKLGQWKLEMAGEAIVLMSGVYTIRNEEQTKTRFRGFPMKESFDFFELLKANKESDKIAVEFEKAVKLGEVIAFHNIYQIDDLNVFTDEIKELSCYSDEKRDWLSQPLTFGDLLENQFDSVPRTVANESGLMKRGRRLDSYTERLYDWQRTRELEEIGWLLERSIL